MNKQRNRSPYGFANINFLGKCNMNCFFCLGKDLENELSQYNCMATHYNQFPKLNEYLDLLKKNGIEQIYLTGQNTDPLIYKYLREFVGFLQSNGFYVGIRTNGLLALKYIDIINMCNTCKGDAVGYSMISLYHFKHKIICGKSIIPKWSEIFKQTTVPYRISIVINSYNKNEILDMINFACNYNPTYIQLRRISTDTREELLKKDIEAYYQFKSDLLCNIGKEYISSYESATVLHDVYPVDVVLWETVSTTANSMNYFTNGIISDEYFIIEGYLKNKDNL